MHPNGSAETLTLRCSHGQPAGGEVTYRFGALPNLSYELPPVWDMGKWRYPRFPERKSTRHLSDGPEILLEEPITARFGIQCGAVLPD